MHFESIVNLSFLLFKRVSKVIDIVSAYGEICLKFKASELHLWRYFTSIFELPSRIIDIWLKKDASDQPISAKGELMVKVFNFQKVSDSSCCVKTFHSVCSNNRKHSTTPLLFPKDGEGDLVSHVKWRKLLPTRLCSVGYDLQFCLISCVHA